MHRRRLTEQQIPFKLLAPAFLPLPIVSALAPLIAMSEFNDARVVTSRVPLPSPVKDVLFSPLRDLVTDTQFDAVLGHFRSRKEFFKPQVLHLLSPEGSE